MKSDVQSLKSLLNLINPLNPGSKVNPWLPKLHSSFQHTAYVEAEQDGYYGFDLEQSVSIIKIPEIKS
jgi:hypothetical protein